MLSTIGNPYKATLTSITVRYSDRNINGVHVSLPSMRPRPLTVTDIIYKQCEYAITGSNQLTTPRLGGEGGNGETFYIPQGDFVIRVEGRSGSEIDKLQFFTNNGSEYLVRFVNYTH